MLLVSAARRRASCAFLRALCPQQQPAALRTLSTFSSESLVQQLLASKDEVATLLRNSKEEVTQAKDEVATLLRASKEDALALVATRAALRREVDEATRRASGVKLRSVVEHLAHTHGDPSKRGVQQRLDALLMTDVALRAQLQRLSEMFQLRLPDLERCSQSLYHTLSKEMHGSDARVEVRVLSWPAATERAALCALLERFCVTYVYVDEAGNEEPSPYATP
jgi:hypothetical protein